MKLQGILELAEFRHEAGNIGKRDDGWLDAALKLECRLYDMLVLDAVGSAQVIKLQLQMRSSMLKSLSRACCWSASSLNLRFLS